MPYHIMTPRFPLGQTYATPGALVLDVDLSTYLHRHHCGDWGEELCAEDKQANEDALIEGTRLLSCYDRSNIVERSASAKEIKRKRGECPGPPSILPKGVAYDRKTHAWSFTDDIKTVQEAFRLFDQEKVTNLTHLANRVGLQRNTLAKILRNPIYKGWRIYDQKRSEEKHQVKNPRTPLKANETARFSRRKVARPENEIIRVQVFKEPAVDPETFDRVQATLAENRCAWQRENIATEINLAVGIGHCAHCGRKLYASSGKRGGGKEELTRLLPMRQ